MEQYWYRYVPLLFLFHYFLQATSLSTSSQSSGAITYQLPSICPPESVSVMLPNVRQRLVASRMHRHRITHCAVWHVQPQRRAQDVAQHDPQLCWDWSWSTGVNVQQVLNCPSIIMNECLDALCHVRACDLHVAYTAETSSSTSFCSTNARSWASWGSPSPPSMAAVVSVPYVLH